MTRYLYPSESEYANLLGGDFVHLHYDITHITQTIRIARELAKTIPQIQEHTADLNVGMVGRKGTGKSLLSSQFLFSSAGEINAIYRHKKGQFRGYSQKLGDMMRLDTWAQSAQDFASSMAAYAVTRSFGKSVLIVEHGQYNQAITYDIVMTLRCHPATEELPSARTLDIRMTPNVSETKAVKRFQNRVKGLSL